MSDAPVCDVILLSWNHLEETRPCLESLFRATRVPIRLIIVDNGSAPDVRAFLAGVKPRGQVREVLLLQNETNEGFPCGMNRGIRASSAPSVCLLNNDTVVTTGWLSEMLEVVNVHPEVGLVNPESNTFGAWPPRGMDREDYAASLRGRHGQYKEVGMCIGFCLLIKREVRERVGELNEEIDRAFFEDEDYSMRVAAAGLRCAVASAAYVYHAEHRSVQTVPEREALFAKNQRWCIERWGQRLRIAWPQFTPVTPGSQELRVWLERMVRWARRRNLLYAYCCLPAGMTGDALFRSVGMVPHADVMVFGLPGWLTAWAAVGRIVKRQKKRFHIIIAPDARWQRLMRGLRWMHRAAVVPESDEQQLHETWQRASRSPS